MRYRFWDKPMPLPQQVDQGAVHLVKENNKLKALLKQMNEKAREFWSKK